MSAADLQYEGYLRHADDSVVSTQCAEARCSECPDESYYDERGVPVGLPVLDGYYCECIECEHGPAGER
jgi:hypothetical protein